MILQVIGSSLRFIALVHNKRFDDALNLIAEITTQHHPILLSVIFHACAQSESQRALEIGRRFLENLPQSYSNVIVLTAAINMFASCGDLTTAEKIFNCMKVKDTAAYNSMIKCYNRNDEPTKSFEIFEQLLQSKITPNQITFLLMINACAKIGMIACCHNIVSRLPPSLLKIKSIQNVLIDMWASLSFCSSTKLNRCYLGQSWFSR